MTLINNDSIGTIKITNGMCIKMEKKIALLLIIIFSFAPFIFASGSCHQHLTPEEFRAKQKAFIIERAGLTKEESAKFFPMYFELQDRKKKLSDESWSLMRKGKEENISENQYLEIIEQVCDNRIASDRLDKIYLDKFKTVLSAKKIYLVQRSEFHFHKELLKNFHNRRENSNR